MKFIFLTLVLLASVCSGQPLRSAIDRDLVDVIAQTILADAPSVRNIIVTWTPSLTQTETIYIEGIGLITSNDIRYQLWAKDILEGSWYMEAEIYTNIYVKPNTNRGQVFIVKAGLKQTNLWSEWNK